MKTNKKLVGTPLFCSLNTHIGLGTQNLIKSSHVEMIFSLGFGQAYSFHSNYLGSV